MTEPVLHGIRMREGPGGEVRYRLPRCAGGVRRIAWGLVILPALLFAVLPLLTWFDLLFGGVMWPSFFPFAVVSLPVAIGLWALFSRQEVVLGPGHLAAVRRLGPLWRTRRRPLAGLRRVVASSFAGRQPAELIAVFADGPPLALACLCEPACLAWLARDLVRRIQEGGEVQGPLPEVAEESLDPAEERPDPPARSRVRVVSHGGGVVFDIPPWGFGKKNLACLLFAGLLLLAGVGNTAWWLWQRPGSLAGVGPWALGLIWWVPGVVILVALLLSGTRRLSLAVSNGCLWVQQIDLFGERAWHWYADDLASISVQYHYPPWGLAFGSFGTTLAFLCAPGPTKPGTLLKIQPRQGKPVLLLSPDTLDMWSDWADKEWLATRLRALLDVPASAEEAKDDGEKTTEQAPA
jgi:hypothetical protein